MLDVDSLIDTLELFADRSVAKKRGQHVRAFRGLRGVPVGEIARILASAYEKPLDLPNEEEGLHRLFMGAYEDGLVAIGLAAASAPDHPHSALDLVERWEPLIDDVETADALGWLVLGPALLVAREPFAKTLLQRRQDPKWGPRRAAVMAAMAALPVPIQGPSAAALRERLGMREVAFVEAPLTRTMQEVCDGFLRDPSPQVQKGLIRVARAWAELEPESVQAWLDGVKGGVPKRLREEVTKGIKRGRRRAAREQG